MSDIKEHILEPRQPGRCKYCKSETPTFCVSCNEYVCENCDTTHRKQYGLGLQVR
ncbi:MAG: hypothetical protein HY316_01530 [Acidobacteria bacterium]|nr:hypothetical protein [Acidobacteriota bacterium]